MNKKHYNDRRTKSNTLAIEASIHLGTRGDCVVHIRISRDFANISEASCFDQYGIVECPATIKR
jgi:hypothetical protein